MSNNAVGIEEANLIEDPPMSTPEQAAWDSTNHVRIESNNRSFID